MKTAHSLIIGLLLATFSSVFAQEADTTKTTPAQITFGYPVGSNGPESKDISNNISFNVLYGVNGGLTGFELGSLVNVINGDVLGCQIAGITNVVDGPVIGGQVAGIANVITDSLYGLQFAGIANISPESTTGAQISGIHNLTNGQLKGAQISGISNVVYGKVEGAQITGIHNLATDSITGAQIGGIFNQSLKATYGTQIGLINSSYFLSGFQLGLINVADSSTGVSVGLINIVKNGYHSVEFFANEVMYANAAIKSGTNQFYNIYTAGYHPEKTNTFGFGIGFGSKLKLAKWLSISADLTVNHINELDKFDWKVNLLNRADLTFDLNLNKHISLIVGPSFNAHVSELGYENTGDFTTNIAVNPFYTDSYDGYQLQMWVGAKGGIRISF